MNMKTEMLSLMEREREREKKKEREREREREKEKERERVCVCDKGVYLRFHCFSQNVKYCILFGFQLKLIRLH